MSSAALKVRNLSVVVDTKAGRKKIVDDVSFDVFPGQATGLVGESGCGKTMTALAILGLIPASGVSISSRSIEINGRDISRLNAAERRRVLGRDIAMVFQQPGTALDPVFTIGQQISAVYRRHTSLNRREIRHTLLGVLEQMGFNRPEEITAAYPHQLSGGMQQLAMIAMATVCKPAVLIADEPTTALDNRTQAVILQQLQRLQIENRTAILLVSHDLAVIRQSCRNVMVMYCGRLVENTDCPSLYSHPRHPYSAGLLSCIPKISAHRPPAIQAIPGQVPALTDLPAGCHFAPRCERAHQRCRQSVPTLITENNRAVACFRPLQ